MVVGMDVLESFGFGLIMKPDGFTKIPGKSPTYDPKHARQGREVGIVRHT